jgi:RNA exonuclease 1
VIDTSLVFPHGKGKPYKRALKTLAAEYLTKIIQDNGRCQVTCQCIVRIERECVVVYLAHGHDSVEDAMTCMELMLWKVKEDLRNTSVKRS